MPRKNAIKNYDPLGIYHIYNRGVNHTAIFYRHADYNYFIRLMQYYLTPSQSEADSLFSHRQFRRPDQDLSQDVELIGFSLMPNHFHLIVRQISERGMTKFMKALSNSYSAYFNRHNERSGHLFESYYQAVQVRTDEQFLVVNRYVHLNSQALNIEPARYLYSNYHSLIRADFRPWMNEHLLLDYFDNKPNQYLDFVEQAPSLIEA